MQYSQIRGLYCKFITSFFNSRHMHAQSRVPSAVLLRPRVYRVATIFSACRRRPRHRCIEAAVPPPSFSLFFLPQIRANPTVGVWPLSCVASTSRLRSWRRLRPLTAPYLLFYAPLSLSLVEGCRGGGGVGEDEEEEERRWVGRKEEAGGKGFGCSAVWERSGGCMRQIREDDIGILDHIYKIGLGLDSFHPFI